MAKNILIVENDAALSRAMKDKLVARGFAVEETTDGKGCAELIRRTKPNLVVLAVDLAAGQNGYIICKKLKSDDELKTIPVVIVGNPDGFGQHKKLKTHADDYLGKPFDPTAIVDRAGNLIGLPELPKAVETVEDGGVNLNELMDEDDKGPEEIPLTSEETVGNGDPDFEMVDAMFDDKVAGGKKADPVSEGEKSAEFQVEEDLPPEVADDLVDETPAPPVEEELSAEPPPPPPSSAPPLAAKPSAAEAGELRGLKSKVTELTSSLSEAKSRADELEEKVQALQTELDGKQAELDTARTSTGKSDSKDLFALKDQINKKDKEILRLKNELNGKDNEVVELHEKETALEQQLSESTGELARKDAQLKTLTTKGDQLAAERKKVDQQMMAAKEEARTTGANLSTLQSEFDALQERAGTFESELESLKSASAETESARQAAESSLEVIRSDHDALKTQHEEKERELEEVRGQMEQAQIDLDSAKNQLTSQATAFAEEVGGLRKRVGELEELSTKHEERVKVLYSRIKSEEGVRDRTREALQQALATLEEQPSENVEELMADDEVAEA